ncbi:FAD-dependent oxidoreductase [Amycolatopsis antarctica]|uniref:FAD-dependent oxidoreductase n=1 Tax=Amycolatopsis antarctica TaxID=1854586 RepID=A0A263D0V7_9PSEU|nr:NAD(P)/FAD-dependent oxidoreductase [Amycolatopsis antarctica]OZM72094.1 FAD-dependent oxidoreductase [Amycolatopsis antarctica]
MATGTDPFLIIGGGPAALSAAHAYREAGGQRPILMLSEDGEPPYLRPPLSKDFLRGESGEDALPIESPAYYRERRIEFSPGDPVTSMDTGARTVTTRAGRTVTYGRCLLATGSEPVRPDVPGAGDPAVLTLRSAASARLLRERADGASGAVVVGSGFIGCEAAVSLARRGLGVTMLCRDSVPQRRRLGADAGRVLRDWLTGEGVEVRTGTALAAVEDGRRVRTDRDETIDAGIVLLATGVRPRADLAEQAGLTVEKGRIRTDEHLRTSAPEVFAAGDVALAHNAAARRPLPVEHWGEAETMGELAGRAAADSPGRWTSVPGFWSVIGDRVLKYAAWGDEVDEARFTGHSGGAFTVWYGRRGATAGVLTHGADEDYEAGAELVRNGAPLP